jgi:hypothetical protein
MLFRLSLKTSENEDFEMARVGVTARNYCRRGINWTVMHNLRATDCSHILQFKVWNKMYTFNQKSNNWWRCVVKFKQ